MLLLVPPLSFCPSNINQTGRMHQQLLRKMIIDKRQNMISKDIFKGSRMIRLEKSRKFGKAQNVCV
jgi:hypothetical protein